MQSISFVVLAIFLLNYVHVVSLYNVRDEENISDDSENGFIPGTSEKILKYAKIFF